MIKLRASDTHEKLQKVTDMKGKLNNNTSCSSTHNLLTRHTELGNDLSHFRDKNLDSFLLEASSERMSEYLLGKRTWLDVGVLKLHMGNSSFQTARTFFGLAQ